MDNIYISRYTQYTMHEFNSKVVNMIVVYFNQINSFSNKLKKEPNFINKIIIKAFIDEWIRNCLFKIILDKNGYDHINVEQCLFTFVAIEAKKLCGNNKNIILIK